MRIRGFKTEYERERIVEAIRFLRAFPHCLTPREWHVFVGYHIRGYTLKVLGEKFDVSGDRIRQIRNLAERKIMNKRERIKDLSSINIWYMQLPDLPIID